MQDQLPILPMGSTVRVERNRSRVPSQQRIEPHHDYAGYMHDRVIGLGSMGLGIATCALAKGLKVIGYDIARISVKRFVDAGGEAAPSAAAAAKGARRCSPLGFVAHRKPRASISIARSSSPCV
jgi:hypothetical protein